MAAEPFLPQLSDVSSGKVKMDVKKQLGGEAQSACLGGEVPGPFQARVSQGSRLLFPRRVKTELPLPDPRFTCLCYLPLPIFLICESEALHAACNFIPECYMVKNMDSGSTQNLY